MKTWIYFLFVVGLITLACWYYNLGKDGFEIMVLVQLLFYAIKNDLNNDNDDSKQHNDYGE